jgi:ribonuclease HI
MSVRVYTDGAVNPHGVGGWAAILFVDGVAIDGRYGGSKNATNNTMELKGLIEGMKLLPTIEQFRCKDCGVVPQPCMEACPEIQGKIKRSVYPDAVIVSDSQYCVKGASEWVYGWQKNGWKTAQKQPVKNQSLWEEIIKLTKIVGCGFQWVKGHSGDPGNELADQWAVAGRLSVYAKSGQGFNMIIPGIGEP